MFNALIEPLQYGFMQRSLIVAILVGLLCAVVGSYLIVRRLALLGDAISHSVLPGLAIAFLLGGNIFIGAFIAGVISTMAIAWICSRSPIKEDAAMGIVFSAFLPLVSPSSPLSKRIIKLTSITFFLATFSALLAKKYATQLSSLR